MAKPTEKPTLVQFVKEEKCAVCNVCKLPDDVRAQIGRSASEKRITQDQQVRWVERVTGKKITVEELKAHVTGRHDVK